MFLMLFATCLKHVQRCKNVRNVVAYQRCYFYMGTVNSLVVYRTIYFLYITPYFKFGGDYYTGSNITTLEKIVDFKISKKIVDFKI